MQPFYPKLTNMKKKFGGIGNTYNFESTDIDNTTEPQRTFMKKTKQPEEIKKPRKSLSIIKLYKLTVPFGEKNPKADMSVLAEFIFFVAKHKDTV